MSLKQSLEKEFGVDVPVRNGAPGSLTVHLDGKRVYSRKEAGTATPAAVIPLIRAKLAHA